MLKYAIVEIAGKQYKVIPGVEILVHNLGDIKELECSKVLLSADEKSVNFGKPYLKETLKFKIVGSVKGDKVRVAKYHSKANTRKVVGSRNDYSKIILA